MAFAPGDDDGILLDDSAIILSTRDDSETLLLDEDEALQEAADPNSDVDYENFNASTPTPSSQSTRAPKTYKSRVHIPTFLKVLKDPKNLRRWFFLGMFTADGANCSKYHDFHLRSNEFDSPSHLLQFVGIKVATFKYVIYFIIAIEPTEICFYPASCASQQVGQQEEHQMEQLQAFENDDIEDVWKHLLWVLGYFDGDGHVEWPDSVRITEFDLMARGKKMLSWIKNRLESIGFTDLTLHMARQRHGRCVTNKLFSKQQY
ncbi:hypothetical protein O0I10_008238 [Lichtheimia ornata]|uniref:Uncharacterized protein n=1 Tax=Lichtheimia ornata TaxID=688661 RepID=A0AAD7XX33_9FUNG|nr:uncharacterized protein O0I10_008238 [Lichtheimia ornata]KAJ8656016.1 hypothetical protein O0I10_008238 [Lichtheimia ornata]